MWRNSVLTGETWGIRINTKTQELAPHSCYRAVAINTVLPQFKARVCMYVLCMCVCDKPKRVALNRDPPCQGCLII